MTRHLRGSAAPSTFHAVAPRAAAYAAAALWAAQGPIWLFAPKVQDHSPPYAIINAPLFVVLWLSIAGAVAFSALAATGAHVIGPQSSRRLRVGYVLQKVTGSLCAVATAATVLAVVPPLEPVAIGAMTASLYVATLTLTAGLTCHALASRRTSRRQRTLSRLTWILAATTILTIVAILGSGTHATLGLYLAVAVVSAGGVAWCRWGNALADTTRAERLARNR